MKILPWLSAKSWSDISAGDRARLARKWFGVGIPYGQSQDGSPAAPLIYDDAVLSAGSPIHHSNIWNATPTRPWCTCGGKTRYARSSA